MKTLVNDLLEVVAAPVSVVECVVRDVAENVGMC